MLRDPMNYLGLHSRAFFPRTMFEIGWMVHNFAHAQSSSTRGNECAVQGAMNMPYGVPNRPALPASNPILDLKSLDERRMAKHGAALIFFRGVRSLSTGGPYRRLWSESFRRACLVFLRFSFV
jgi:hypothetical protein